MNQPTINRGVLVLIHQPAFYNWVLSFDPDSGFDFQEEPMEISSYLISDEIDPHELEDEVFALHPFLFEHELVGWTEDESVWPAKRDFETFRTFFKWQYSSLVFDLEEIPLVREEDEDE
jgi:hypothetical protein